ncbi:MAG TPA: sigma-54 dependent transcriptional regulator [Desulfovibrio sp.]|uniref:sigma-54-dependent transcriptional regulator n=1 Tax=Desulfovibrio sp. TaxID=885 RepID=UPI002B794047|nr:sigma-54 dependent transcriptional regulator [Desulfovibrio sp.]HMM38066.1 sigma-54 dependent transcriptional regulator [Desulfovibrio sp.]
MDRHTFPARPILVVDDERAALDGFEITLVSSGYTNIVTLDDSRKVLPFLVKNNVELILLDLIMPHLSGSELLLEIRRICPDVPVLIITAVNDVDSVVECIRNGAQDYIIKPVDKDHLRNRVRKALEVRELEQENALLRESLLDEALLHPEAFAEIVTQDPKMCAIFKYCEAVAPSTRPILITGETGTGKELIARSIHDLSGRKGEFVAVNIAAFDDPTFADTLFGHVRGAFTGAESARPGLVEKAAGGTLFLDEIGDLPLPSQVKLLRLLQEQEYFPVGSDSLKKANVRIVASTLKNIGDLRRKGQFREDLYYRLITHQVHIPPLRERPNDIPRLLDHFLDQDARELRRKRPSYHPELVNLLRSYAFPGNVRELRAMVGDALMNHTSRMLSSETFKRYIFQEGEPETRGAEGRSANPLDNLDFSADNMPRLKVATQKVAQILISQAMRISCGNQTVAARILGISQQALSAKLKKVSLCESDSEGDLDAPAR